MQCICINIKDNKNICMYVMYTCVFVIQNKLHILYLVYFWKNYTQCSNVLITEGNTQNNYREKKTSSED